LKPLAQIGRLDAAYSTVEPSDLGQVTRMRLGEIVLLAELGSHSTLRSGRYLCGYAPQGAVVG
jgi:hypothetical protein